MSNMFSNLIMAVRGIGSNWLRTLLTMLGVLIGVASVIVLLAIGTGTSRSIENSIQALGSNTLTVFNSGGSGTSSGTQIRNTNLNSASVSLISNANNAPDVQSVSPVITTSVTATNGSSTYSTSVIGSTPSYLVASNYTVSAGRSISTADVTSHSQVIDIGASVASGLFPVGSNPLGQQIELGSSRFTIVGLLASKGSTGLTNADAVAIAPYTAVQDQLTGESQSFSELLIQGKSAATLSLAQSEVQSILAAQNNTTVAALPFNVLNQASLITTATSSSKTFTALLGWVAAVSLLVGAIGVMNIMLVTVTERTREIGIRKAIGARKSVVLTQFLIESTVISFMGGVLGAVAGIVVSRFTIAGVKPVLASYSIPLALGVALSVGIVAGFYPAYRAASLRPIDALRYE
ncbi:MAG TPA: ABC transporter permease [Acidimicrobiales bacterium]|nr:ABC transporter permease [Acidimicrobiales bacterium]